MFDGGVVVCRSSKVDGNKCTMVGVQAAANDAWAGHGERARAMHDICSCTMQAPDSINSLLYYWHDITVQIRVSAKSK